MLFPFIILLVIVFLFRSELGLKGILITLAISIGTVIGFLLQIINPGWFIVVHSVLDIVLVIMLFGNVRSY